jgi:MYXO-CTERM domain-containing protein
VQPSSPFAGLTLDQLTAANLAGHYREAVVTEIARYRGRAFVIEGAYTIGDLKARRVMGGRLAELVDSPEAVLTRMSGVFGAAQLKDDVAFQKELREWPPSQRTLASVSSGGDGPGIALLPALALAGALATRRVRKYLARRHPAPIPAA